MERRGIEPRTFALRRRPEPNESMGCQREYPRKWEILGCTGTNLSHTGVRSVSFSRSTRQLLRALRRGETVEKHLISIWRTSGGDRASSQDVHILVNAGLAVFYEWGLTPANLRIGTKARIAPPAAARAPPSPGVPTDRP